MNKLFRNAYRRELKNWNCFRMCLVFLVLSLTDACGPDAFAQVWQQVATDNLSIDALDTSRMTIVGDHGKILQSTDAGASWSQQLSGTRRRLSRVRNADGNVLVAVGDSGSIIHSTDAGTTWTSVSSPTTSSLLGLDFADANVGFAVGRAGVIMKTTNAGRAWTRLESGVGVLLLDVHALDRNTIVVVGDSGMVLLSEDGGATWFRQLTDTKSILRRVRFGSRRFCVAAGDNATLLTSQDGGQTWLRRDGHDLGTIFALVVLEPATIIAGGIGDHSSQVSRSTDGGITWASLGQFEPNHLQNVVRDFHVFDSEHFVAVGNPSLIAKSTDHGVHWSTISHAPLIVAGSNELVGLYSAGFGSGDTGLIGGASSGGGTPYLRTSDRGTTWVSGELPNVSQIHGIHFFDADSAMAILNSSLVYRSGDGGITWVPDYGTPQTPRWSVPMSLAFTDRFNGVMVSDSIVYRTTDGGYSWVGSVVPNTVYLTQVQFITPRLAFVASFGKVLRTRDGGATWEQIFSRPTNRGNAIWFLDSMVGFTTGAVGFLHRTFDAGATWDSLDIGARVFLDDILFLNDRVGYIVGDPGAFLLKTTDAGRNWFREQPWPEDPSDRIIELYHLYALPDRRTLLAFGNGVILRGSFDEPFSSVEDLQTTNRTESVRLHIQPNPATRTEVTVDVNLGLDAVFDAPPRIVVFDLLGRIVSAQPVQLRQLLDKRSYRTIVDASELYPGMYFVRFEVGSTTATESLVIVPGD